MRPALVVVAFGILLVAHASAPAAAAAQERLCDIRAPGRTSQTIEGMDTLVVLHDPFFVNCSDGAELRANSGRYSRGSAQLHLIGSVYFRDSTRTLTAEEATYNSGTGRLWANQDVTFENLEEGSTLRGPELEYFRSTDERPQAQVTATQRPRLTLPPPQDDEAGEGSEEDDAEPLELVADRVLIIGEDDLSAFGSVIITRTDMYATAGEARYNSASEDLELRQNAVIESEEFDLGGEVIQARLTEGALEQVHSRTEASLVGEDLRVTAPDLQLFFASDLLQRAVATIGADSSGARASALSRTFQIQADSLDATFVDQQIDVVYAVGSARGETIDTLAPPPASASSTAAGGVESDSIIDAEAAAPDDETSRAALDVLARDWIMGDTIVGYFAAVEPDSAAVELEGAVEAARLAAGDTLQVESDEAPPPEVEIRRLIAYGSAESLYRMAPEGETATSGERRNVNFLVGDRIELELAEGELQVAHVTGLQQGVFLEAAPESNGGSGMLGVPATPLVEEPQGPPGASQLPDGL